MKSKSNKKELKKLCKVQRFVKEKISHKKIYLKFNNNIIFFN